MGIAFVKTERVRVCWENYENFSMDRIRGRGIKGEVKRD